MRQLDIFATNSYHNTVPVREEAVLESRERKARSQDEKIYAFLKEHPHQSFTPAQIHLLFGQCWPLTSVRRSLTNLTKNRDDVVMTGEVRPGLFGRENRCWKYSNPKP